jgi:DNA-binding MarR family transcriptional regulator
MRRPNRKRSRAARRQPAAPAGRGSHGRRVRRPGRGAQGGVDFVADFQRLIGEIFRFNGRLLDVAAGLSADLGVTPTHWQTVAIIRDEPMTVSQISRRVGLRRQSVQHTVRQLLDRSLVEMVANPRHQRARLVRLTAAGRALMRELLARQVTLTHMFTENLGYTSRDIERVIGILRHMQEAADRQHHDQAQ